MQVQRVVRSFFAVVVVSLIVAQIDLPSAHAGKPSKVPTPTPIPPQCSSVPCGGSCTIRPPCTPGPITVCPQYVVLGECKADAAGACQCAPVQPPTPLPTPTPQCSSVPCGGSCAICPPCTPGTICPLGPCRLGECQATAVAVGACQCVPIQTPTQRPHRPSMNATRQRTTARLEKRAIAAAAPGCACRLFSPVVRCRVHHHPRRERSVCRTATYAVSARIRRRCVWILRGWKLNGCVQPVAQDS